MRGIGNNKIVEYVCESDRSLPEDEQTVFVLRCKNGLMASKSNRRYSKVFQESRDGSREYDDRKGLSADIEEFQDNCTEVLNFFYSEDYLEGHPNVRAMADEKGRVAKIDDPNLKADLIRYEIPEAQQRELFAAMNDPVKLDRGAKKNLNS